MKKIKISQISLLSHGQFVSLFGDTLFSVALSYAILKKTGSTAVMASMNTVAMICRIAFSFVTGPFLDGLDRKKVIITSDLVRGVTVLLLALAAKNGLDSLPLYYLVMCILGMVGAVFKPVVNASVTDLAEKESIDQANARINNSAFLAEIIGEAVCSKVFDFVSFLFLYVANGISYIYSAITEIWLKIPHKKRDVKETAKRNIGKDFVNGYKFVLTQKSLLSFIAFCMFLNLFMCAVDILYVPFFENENGLGIQGYSYSMIAFMVGTVIVSTLVSRNVIKIKYPFACVIIPTLIYSLLGLLMSRTTNLYLMLGIFLGLGMVHALRQTVLLSALQRGIDKEHKGMAFSFYSLSLNLLKPVSYMLGGILAEHLLIRHIYGIAFWCVIAGAIIFYFIGYFRKFIEGEKRTESTNV